MFTDRETEAGSGEEVTSERGLLAQPSAAGSRRRSHREAVSTGDRSPRRSKHPLLQTELRGPRRTPLARPGVPRCSQALGCQGGPHPDQASSAATFAGRGRSRGPQQRSPAGPPRREWERRGAQGRPPCLTRFPSKLPGKIPGEPAG